MDAAPIARLARLARRTLFAPFAPFALFAPLAAAHAAPEGARVAVAPALQRALASGSGIESAAALRGALRALLAPGAPAWDADCEADRRATGGAAGIIRHPLGDGSWLLQVVCAQGAYQGSFWAARLWGAPHGAARPDAGGGQAALLAWPVVGEPAGAAAAPASAPPAWPAPTSQVVVWGELEAVAPRAGADPEVEIVNRFRAAGDCGTRARYALRGARPELVALAAVFVCPDTVGLPGAWPRIAVPGR